MNECMYCKKPMRDDLDFCPNCHKQNFPCIECGKLPCMCHIDDKLITLKEIDEGYTQQDVDLILNKKKVV